MDAYSGFFEVDVLNDESAFTTISCLKKLFATHGIPDEYKSDNGPQFDCREFTKFCQDWCFEHVTSSPRFAQSNGRVERAVETAKMLFSKAYAEGKYPYLALLSYRNTLALIVQMVRAFGMNLMVGGLSPSQVETFSVSKTLALSQEHLFMCRK